MPDAGYHNRCYIEEGMKTGSLHINWWDQIWGKQRSGKVLTKVITSFTWNKSNLMQANGSRHLKSLRLGHMRKLTLWKIPVQTQYTWDQNCWGKTVEDHF